MEIDTENLPDGYVIVLTHFVGKRQEVVSIFIDENDVPKPLKKEEFKSYMAKAYDFLMEREAVNLMNAK